MTGFLLSCILFKSCKILPRIDTRLIADIHYTSLFYFFFQTNIGNIGSVIFTWSYRYSAFRIALFQLIIYCQRHSILVINAIPSHVITYAYKLYHINLEFKLNILFCGYLSLDNIFLSFVALKQKKKIIKKASHF